MSEAGRLATCIRYLVALTAWWCFVRRSLVSKLVVLGHMKPVRSASPGQHDDGCKVVPGSMPRRPRVARRSRIITNANGDEEVQEGHVLQVASWEEERD